MFGIDDPSAAATLPVPEPAGIMGFWTEGNPALGQAATLMRASFFNGLQQELLNILAAAGIAPSKTSYNQLLSAIRSLGTSPSVPTMFVGYEITVTQPHLRKMVWNGTAYVRAPWHQPGMVKFSYDNPATIDGYLPIRADASYNQASYPDLVARLGLSGVGTFSLIDARGEFIRCLDNGRGVDTGRALRSAQAGDNKPHTHTATQANHNHPVNDPAHAHSAWTDTQGWHNHAYGPRGTWGGPGLVDSPTAWSSGTPYTEGAGNHGHNIGIGGATTGITIGANGAAISISTDGTEARPRNVAFTAWVSY